MGTRTSTFGRVCFLNVFLPLVAVFGFLEFYFFFFFFFFAAILDFTDVKNVTEGRRREWDQTRFFMWIDFFSSLFCPVLQQSAVVCVQCPVSPSSETHRPFFNFFESCSHVKTTLHGDDFRRRLRSRKSGEED